MVARAPSSAGVILGGNPGCAISILGVCGTQVAKFTGSGTLNILDSGCGVSGDYLVIGGGGGGGQGTSGSANGGGGGAGGYRTSFCAPTVDPISFATGTKYTVTTDRDWETSY